MQMRSILMIVLLPLCIVGCDKNNDGGGDVKSTTLNDRKSNIIVPPGEELKAQGYNDQYEIVIPASAIMSDKQERVGIKYRKEWKRVNNNPTNGYRLVDGHIEANLDNLPFKKAFRLQHRVRGEGHTFWWQGHEYTTDLLKD